MASLDLRDRLRGMLLETPSISASKSRPLIQVLDSEVGKELTSAIGDRIDLDLKASGDNEVGDCDNDNCNYSDDEGPPPIFSIKHTTSEGLKVEPSPSFRPTNSSRLDERSNPDSPSLAEQLLADAALAKEESQKQQMQREKLAAKRSTFGVKRGFLNSTSKKSNRKEKAVTQEINSMRMVKKEESKAGEVRIEGRQEELIYELDHDGNIIPSSSTSSDGHQSHGRNNPLHLSEVQSAMLSHLETNANMWARPDLLDTILQRHPNLARGMNDPRFVSALQAMQTNPKEALENLKKNSPEIVDWLKEFCGAMGEHFVRLGEVQDKANNSSGTEGGMDANASKVREMGPLEKKALKKHMDVTKDQSSSPWQNKDAAAESVKDMNKRVSAVLANDELRSILLDPVLQQIMEECSTGGSRLRFYLGHEEYGPKLRKLMDAGLIRVA